MTPGKLGYLILLSTLLALGVVWQSATIRQTGYRLEELQDQIAEQEAEAALFQAQLSKLRNPQRIVALVNWLGLELQERAVPPTEMIVERVRSAAVVAVLSDEPEPAPPAPARQELGEPEEVSVAALTPF
ncbi:MAG: hypothetical protein ACYS8K_10905 [Planctomycetota bacterium]|jgi:hypothetical protein